MNIDELILLGSYDRDYRICQRPGSLAPNIAYSLNQIAGLSDNDRVLDPCCGTATILIERQLLKPGICIGVDIDPRALDCAKQNIEAAKVEVELIHGDITEKKFPEGYFTKIISNLPYGLKSGSREKNIKLYNALADKCELWLKKGGKAVFLTNAKKLLWNAFAEKSNLKFIEEFEMKNSGLNLAIFVFEKV